MELWLDSCIKGVNTGNRGWLIETVQGKVKVKQTKAYLGFKGLNIGLPEEGVGIM